MRWGLTVQTAATLEPLNTAEVREYLNLVEPVDEALLLRQIKAGREKVETRTRRCLLTTTFNLYYPNWPRVIIVPRPPLQSVSFIKYLDDDGTYQTLATTLYDVDDSIEPARIYPGWGDVWPSVRTLPKAIHVQYVAGWTSAANVPASIKEAVAAYVASLYDERGLLVPGGMSELPFSAKHLLDTYIVKDYALTQGGG